MSSVDELWADLQAQESHFNAYHALRVKVKQKQLDQQDKLNEAKKKEQLQNCDATERIIPLATASFSPLSAHEPLKEWSRNICLM